MSDNDTVDNAAAEDIYEFADLSDVRQKAMDKVKEILPAPYGSKQWAANPYHSVPSGKSGYTNCVEFPAYVVWLASGKKFIPGFPAPSTRGWVDADGSARPQPGDIYVLCKGETQDESLSHVGVIVSADGDTWRTADWGQGNGWSGDFVTRTYDEAAGTLTGEVDASKGNTRPPRALKGWVDLDVYCSE
jgi:hypothetical protein